MWIFSFYRLYLSVAAAAAVYFLLLPQWWIWPLVAIAARAAWFGIEHSLYAWRIGRDFSAHISQFKQQYGIEADEFTAYLQESEPQIARQLEILETGIDSDIAGRWQRGEADENELNAWQEQVQRWKRLVIQRST